MIGFLGKYKKIFGIFGLLVVICAFTTVMAYDSFTLPANIENTVRWTALFGIISIGVSFVIMTGGIDLSIGSVVGLVGCVLAMSLATTYRPDLVAPVQRVDVDARVLDLEGDAKQFRPGMSVLYLGESYRVESSSDAQVTLSDEIRTGESTGNLQLAHAVISLSGQQAAPVRRGATTMGSRTLVLRGDVSAKPGDQIGLIYGVGLPQEFTIRKITAGSEETKVEFFVRLNQKIRKPDFVLIEKRSQRCSTPVGILIALGVSLLIGLFHGLLIAKVKLQPFVVTLCGLLIYRGLARFLTGDQEQGFGSEYPFLKQLAKGDFLHILTGDEFVFDIPMPFIYMVILGIVAAVFLNKTIFGRYILALGRNEEAARYSGINTDRMVIISYMICSLCAGFAAILFALDLNSIQPSGHGEFYELYAIAAAVLGGCSLRGGEGSILGVIIAAAVLRVLNNAINLIDGIDTSTEFAIIGFVILLGVVVDETVRRFAARRKAFETSTGVASKPQ